MAQSTESGRYLALDVELFEEYETVQDFAADCRKLTDSILACGVQPNRVTFTSEPEQDRKDDLDKGTVPQAEYILKLDGAVQMNWTAGQMAGQTTVIELLEEENELPPETEES